MTLVSSHPCCCCILPTNPLRQRPRTDAACPYCTVVQPLRRSSPCPWEAIFRDRVRAIAVCRHIKYVLLTGRRSPSKVVHVHAIDEGASGNFCCSILVLMGGQEGNLNRAIGRIRRPAAISMKQNTGQDNVDSVGRSG
jgi:hypothetical protein